MNTYLARTVFALLLLFPGLGLGATKLVESESSAYGASYQEALSAALLGAVSQVRGLESESSVQLELSLKAVTKGETVVETGKLGTVQKPLASARGWVDSYTLTEVREPATQGDSWFVALKAQVPIDSSRDSKDTRPRISVLPFRFNHPTFALNGYGQTSNAHQIAKRVRDIVLARLTQSGNVQVVNRSYGDEIDQEFALLSSAAVAPKEASRLGNVYGADWMLVGNVHDLSTRTERKTFYGAEKIRSVDHAEFAYQLIEVSSQKIVWADTIIDDRERTAEDTPGQTLDWLAGKIVSGILGTLQPVRILERVSDTEVYLNQGQARIAVDQLFSVFSPSRSVKDPETGELIAIEGRPTATLRVSEVRPKYSIAELSSGSPSSVRKGAIVRQTEPEEKPKISDKAVRETPGSSEKPFKW